MKLYYIVSIKQQHIGVNKKIKAQLKGFKDLGLKTSLIDVNQEDTIIKKILRRTTLSNYTDDWSRVNIKSENAIYYFRYPLADRSFLKILKKIKKEDINSKIIVEIPTFPYENEGNSVINKILIKKDKFFRKSLHKYVDRIATYSDDDEIYNIPTLRISNYIDYSEIKRRNPCEHRGINLVAVATFDYWHGYDRLIRGIGEYYSNIIDKDKDVFLHMVGEGPELEKYKCLTKELGIECNVIFHGRKVGEELDNIYNISDIAIDSLGRHRTGIFYNSTLKGKEYCAKGLPILSGVRTELDEDENYLYYYRVQQDDSNIEIQEIIKFYNEIYLGRDEMDIANNIREYSYNKFNVHTCLQSIISYIYE